MDTSTDLCGDKTMVRLMLAYVVAGVGTPVAVGQVYLAMLYAVA